MDKYKIKRALSAGTGLLRLKWRSLSPGLFVFNYHRIGDANLTRFDPNVFSCDEIHLAAQLGVIQSRFRLIDVKELVSIISSGKALNEPTAMITFDDGYADNFSKAYPVLKRLGIPALFFLPTSFIDSERIPWWDEVAWMLTNTSEKEIWFPGVERPFLINKKDRAGTIRKTLRYFKDSAVVSLSEKLSDLEQICKCRPSSSDAASLFMTWNQIREMIEGGMHMGSHTHTHQILSHLQSAEQKLELEKSKQILEEKTGSSILALAYPVGGRDSYTPETAELARECGYQLAFSAPNENGFNTNLAENSFELARIQIEKQANPLDVKYSAAFAVAL